MRAAWWWIDRWRKSTAYICMNLEEQALYRNLLDAVWLFDGRPIPDDLKTLISASGGDADAWARGGAKVLQWMRRVEGGWVNDTATEVMKDTKVLSKARSKAGKKGAAHRWQTDSNGNGKPITTTETSGVTNGITKLSPPSPSPSPSPDPKPEERKKEPASLSSVSRDPFTDQKITERAGNFVRRYEELYPLQRFGARYAVHPVRDYAAAVSLCSTWTDDARLEKLAICFLTTDHKFAAEGSRTLPQFLALASWCDGELSAWEKTRA